VSFLSAAPIDTSYGANVRLPAFDARIGIGFNYDFLKEPTDVSFEYPKAYFGMNLPLNKNANLRDFTGYIDPAIDSMFADSNVISNGNEFKPNANARQNPNMTIRVEVPMMGGVASFSNIQNFYFNYTNVLGNPNIFANPSNLADGMEFLLRGTVNVPMSMSMYWETMTFGYAYKLNRFFIVALNLHRHTFSLDFRAKVDVDLMGRYDISMGSGGNSGVDIPSINGTIDYSSQKIYGSAYGHYEADVWTPTLGLKAWRFTITSRFGINTKAKGELYGRYSLPFFIDPESFSTKYDFNSTATFNNPEVRSGLLANATDSVVYSTKKKIGNETVDSDLIWKMPTALSMSFDLIPKKIKVSYTKLFGEVAMKLDRIAMETNALEASSTRDSTRDSIVLDVGVQVDHVIMLQCNLWNSFINLGVCAFDIRESDQEHILGKNMPFMKMGESAMLPIVNIGTAIGSKFQLLLELDILPLPAVKTGIYYNF
jgi:hypothetical protein